MSASETLSALKEAITAERSASMEKFDKELAQIGSLESTIEDEKKAYGEEIRKETLAKIDDMDGEGRLYTEADMDALKETQKAELAKANSQVEEATASKAKAEAATKTAEAKADRFKEKFETQRASYKSAQERENELEAEVTAAGQDDEEAPSEVINEETGEVTRR